MIGLLASILPGMFKLGGKLIEDKDKKAEYAFKVQEMAQSLAFKMLETKTYPWIDGLVKLAYASEAIIKGLFRPVFSCGLFVWGLLNPESIAELQNLDFGGDVAVATIFGAAPAWGVDRGLEKRKKKQSTDAWDED